MGILTIVIGLLQTKSDWKCLEDNDFFFFKFSFYIGVYLACNVAFPLKSAFSGDFGKHKNRKAQPFRKRMTNSSDYMINTVSESDFHSFHSML